MCLHGIAFVAGLWVTLTEFKPKKVGEGKDGAATAYVLGQGSKWIVWRVSQVI